MTVPLAVTTAVKLGAAVEAQAQSLAAELHAPFVPRLGRPLPQIFAASGEGFEVARLLIAGADHLRLKDRASGTEYYFHPNMFLIRGSHVLRGEPDHFLQATGLGPGDSLLDGTLGFASEAALASLIVGDQGLVLGLESVRELAAVTRAGIRDFPMSNAVLGAALRRVQVVTADHGAYLRGCAAHSFDVVYFDPFFDKRLAGSEASVSPLFVFGNPAPLDPDAVREACRIARRRVVIKHPRHEPLPELVSVLISETVGSRKSRLVYSVIGL
jgi:16S rRNA (guanine1516-N2)-methyltransferase